MDKINKILKRSMGKKGLMGAATSAHICFLAEKWARGRFLPISYSRGVLKVSVKSSSHAQELSMKQDEICEYVNSKIGRKCLKKIRIITSN